MGTSKYKEYALGAYYHIYNRGNGRKDIFLDDQDYYVYLNRLSKAKDKNGVTIISYCLMPNHIHLLLRQDTKKPVYKFISSVHTSYSMYFNKKYDDVGHLFQGRFKQKIVDKDEYLLHLSRYIHLNPIESRLVENLNNYRWSSYLDFVGERKDNLCKKEIIDH